MRATNSDSASSEESDQEYSDTENSQESDQEYDPSDGNSVSELEEEEEDDADDDNEDSSVSLADSEDEKEEEIPAEEEGKTWEELEEEAREEEEEREDNSDSYERRMKAFNWWVPERDTASSRPRSNSLVDSDVEYKGEDSDQDSEVEKAKPRKAGRDKESSKPEKCDKRKMNGFGSQVVDKKDPGRSFRKKPKLG